MRQNLLTYINQYTSYPLTREEEALVTAAFQMKKIRQKQYFLQERDVCKYTGFIANGAMRQYSIDEKGVEHIVYLYIENYWATDRGSFIYPNNTNIDEFLNLAYVEEDSCLFAFYQKY